MGRVEVFEHTADIGLRLEGRDLADLFATAAEGLFSLIVANWREVRAADEETIELAAESTEELFLAWLNELIFRCEARHRFYGRFQVELDAAGRSLRAVIAGEPICPERHLLDHEIKAATRHGLSLRRENSGWAAEVILDV